MVGAQGAIAGLVRSGSDGWMFRFACCRPVVAAIALTLVASTGVVGTSIASASRPLTTPEGPTYEPKFETTACDGVVPADPRVECGVLTVPVDRDHPKQGDVTLPVAIIRSGDPDPLPDPIVFFAGGPGGPARISTRLLMEVNVGGRRDVIVFDQRGTGQSTPSLDCPEQLEIVWQTFGAARDPQAEADGFREALASCRKRLVSEGVDLDAYDTSTTTDDVADLRTALGIKRWNLFGVSYGTMVALEMLRRHPEGVRSAVIDSVIPTDEPAGASQHLKVAERALAKLFSGCASDPKCSAAYPTLEDDFDALVEEWNAQPFEVTATDPTGQPRQLVITGDDLVAAVWNAMYNNNVIPLLPSLVGQLRARGEVAGTFVPQLVAAGVNQLTVGAEAMGSAVICADRQRLIGPDQDKVIADNPRFAGLLSLRTREDACDVMRVKSVPAAFNQPVRSNVPVLVYGDEYDPVTPPENSRRAARTLDNSTFVATHGLGHGVTRKSECTLEIFGAFLTDPTTPVDITCASDMLGPAWAA
jgi:pimeloyl-ACP methyl ester carboxylesterase